MKYLLRNLDPSEGLDVYTGRRRHSLRDQGSFKQILKKPTKYVDSVRPYVHGDPTRFIDWKLFGRTDQLLIRQVNERSSVRVTASVWVDDTMFWPSEEEAKTLPNVLPTKFESAVRLALALAANHLREGDTVTLRLQGSDIGTMQSKLRSMNEAVQLFHFFDQRGFAKDSLLSSPLVTTQTPVSQTSQVYYHISDLIHEKLPEISFLGQESYLIHLLSSYETGVGWVNTSSNYKFDQSENDEFSGREIKNQYMNELRKWFSRNKEICSHKGAAYVVLDDGTPVDLIVPKLMEALAR